MIKIINLPSRHQRPPEVNEVESIQLSPQGRNEPKHKQLIALSGADWLEGPQGLMSLADMLTAAGFEVDRGQGLVLATPPASSGNNSPPSTAMDGHTQ
eukprot:602882-Karenia_brevis.AAC.1